jgi:cell division protein FtsQ
MQVISSVEDAFVLRRRQLRQAQGRRRLMLLLGAVGVVVAVAGYWGLRMSSAFDVTRVQVVGATGPLTKQVEQAVSADTHGKSLLGMDAGTIERRIEAIPYVQSARVDRAFPHTLAVHVVPYTPAAYAMIGKQVYPIAADGRVLADHGKVPHAAPVVMLPDGTTLAVGQHTGDENIASALEVLNHAGGIGGHVTQLLPRSGTITAVLGKGVQLRFGAPSDLTLKMEVVQRVLRRITGAQRHELAYLDVSAPSRPALGFHGTSPSTTT